MDEHTRECLSIDVARSLKSEDVLERLSDLFVCRGVPKYLRSDNGSEFTAHKVRDWLERVGVQTLFIEPGSPWENGYIESFNGKLRDEFLDRELFDTMLEGKVLIERWRKHYNTVRPHSSLGYQPPAPEAIQSRSFTSATPQQTTGTGKLRKEKRNLNTGVAIRGRSARSRLPWNSFYEAMKGVRDTAASPKTPNSSPGGPLATTAAQVANWSILHGRIGGKR